MRSPIAGRVLTPRMRGPRGRFVPAGSPARRDRRLPAAARRAGGLRAPSRRPAGRRTRLPRCFRTPPPSSAGAILSISAATLAQPAHGVGGAETGARPAAAREVRGRGRLRQRGRSLRRDGGQGQDLLGSELAPLADAAVSCALGPDDRLVAEKKKTPRRRGALQPRERDSLRARAGRRRPRRARPRRRARGAERLARSLAAPTLAAPNRLGALRVEPRHACRGAWRAGARRRRTRSPWRAAPGTRGRRTRRLGAAAPGARRRRSRRRARVALARGAGTRCAGARSAGAAARLTAGVAAEALDPDLRHVLARGFLDLGFLSVRELDFHFVTHL